MVNKGGQLMTEAKDTLKGLSQGMIEAVRNGAASTVLVDARESYGASGFAYRADRVLTSDHAVENQEAITVELADGRAVKAALAGRDPGSDLAVLRLEQPAATPGEAAPAEPQVGQLVLALARPTRDGIQATLGVVSIVGGRYQLWQGGFVEGVMRTDAAAFPGFAGGPLVDTDGKLVGINTFGLSFGSSLTIPARRALEIAEKLDREGSVRRGYLGIRSQHSELPNGVSLGRDRKAGLLVVGVEKDSPASHGGLLVGDIVVAVEGSPCADHQELLAALADKAGETVSVEMVRGGKPARLEVRIGEAEAGAAAPGPSWGVWGRWGRRRR
jgi:S1-C subfamily serine protease